jgi:hypothetical protein
MRQMLSTLMNHDSGKLTREVAVSLIDGVALRLLCFSKCPNQRSLVYHCDKRSGGIVRVSRRPT